MLHVVSAFDVPSDMPVVKGTITLPVDLLPLCIEMGKGQTIDVEKMDWGPNFALVPEVQGEADGLPDYPDDKTAENSAAKVNNGTMESSFYTQLKDARPWTSHVTDSPAAFTLTWPEPAVMNRVNVFAAPPPPRGNIRGPCWIMTCNTVRNGKWVTIEHIREPFTIVKAVPPATGTKVDSYASDRWVFHHHFAPVTTQRLRLLFHDVTWGGAPTQESAKASGQDGFHQATLREVQVFGPTVNGLRGEYFMGENFQSKFLTRTDNTVNFPNWWTALPQIDHKQFSVRWTRSIRPRYSEEYTFFTDADDGVRLWIDGKLLVNRIYSVQLEYYENGGGEAIRL